MTPDESFEKWWALPTPIPDDGTTPLAKAIAKQAYLAATRATAMRCVEIAKHYPAVFDEARDIAKAIEHEFGL